MKLTWFQSYNLAVIVGNGKAALMDIRIDGKELSVN